MGSTSETTDDAALAAACARGEASAIAEIERRHFANARAAVERIVGASATDEAMQVVRHKLFVAEPGERPRIAEYEGRGSLGGWLRVVAVRTALTLRRGEKREGKRRDSDDALADLPASPHPEIEPLRAQYQAEFKEAFQGALAGLSARERNLLRLSFLDGLSVDQIGAVYQVHRATAARWVQRAREQLLEETKRRLYEKLRLSPSELQSLVAMVQSQVDVSIHRFLGEEAE